MADAVRELFTHNPAQHGRLARQHAERHYSWDRVVQDLLIHYHAVLGSEQPVVAHV